MNLSIEDQVKIATSVLLTAAATFVILEVVDFTKRQKANKKFNERRLQVLEKINTEVSMQIRNNDEIRFKQIIKDNDL